MYVRFRYHLWAEVAILGQLASQPVSQFLHSLQRGGEFGIISVTLRKLIAILLPTMNDKVIDT